MFLSLIRVDFVMDNQCFITLSYVAIFLQTLEIETL